MEFVLSKELNKGIDCIVCQVIFIVKNSQFFFFLPQNSFSLNFYLNDYSSYIDEECSIIEAKLPFSDKYVEFCPCEQGLYCEPEESKEGDSIVSFFRII